MYILSPKRNSTCAFNLLRLNNNIKWRSAWVLFLHINWSLNCNWFQKDNLSWYLADSKEGDFKNTLYIAFFILYLILYLKDNLPWYLADSKEDNFKNSPCIFASLNPFNRVFLKLENVQRYKTYSKKVTNSHIVAVAKLQWLKLSLNWLHIRHIRQT